MNITRRDPFSAIPWEPFREMEEAWRQFSPFFGRGLTGPAEGASSWRPVANISESEKEYLIKAELPEVKKEDIEITVEDGMLTLRGERKYEKEEGESNDLRVESFYGSFSRSFGLPDNIDTSKISAECKDGILKVHIPKTETRKSKPVSVQIR